MSNYAYVRGQESDAGMSTATAGAPPDTGIPGNPYDKLYHYDDEDYYDPHCFFSSGLAQNRKRLGFIATCSTVQCKDAGSAGYDPLLPFKEDLAEWLYKMIRAEIAPNRFFPELQSGVYLCKLGIHMQKMAVKYRREHPEDKSLVPPKPPNLKYANATRKSPPFYCRDNISNFLDWSIEFGVKHSCRFETDDLTLRKNDRQIVIHLMEVGRLGVKFGIEPPTLIKLEMSLEDPMPAPVKGASTLDEKVQACAAECTCSVPFKVNRVSEGRYKVGEGRSIVFVRVLRSHVMVRVGGGWETLNAYFSKMDPCRAPMDSFGGKAAGSPTGKLKQRFGSADDLEQPISPAAREPEPEPEPEIEEVEEDSAPPPVVTETVAPVQAAVPPAKPKRPVSSPSPAAIAATSDPLKKPGPPRTRSPTKSPLRAASPKKSPAPKQPTVPRESVTSPTPRPASTRAPTITPRQTKASLLRTSSPSAIKTPSPANGVSPTKASPSPGSGGLAHPPWRFVPNQASPVARTNSAPQKPASRTSGEAGPSTPNFQRPNRASTLDRKEPPTQNKRLIPVGGKNLPKSDKYNRATQRVPGKPKITSPELIRRAMEIMKDNGEVEAEEEVVRTPTEPALIAAIEEIAEEEYQCEAGETVDVEVPDPLPEPAAPEPPVVPDPLPEPSVTDFAPDSGVDTLAESKPRVTDNATVGDSSVPVMSGGDTLQDISDMITDDQDRSEMENLEELPSDDAGYEVQDLPSQDLVIEPIGLYYDDEATEEFEPVIEAETVAEVAAEAPQPLQPEPQIAEVEPQVAEAEPQIETEPLVGAGGEQSDYEGGTTEDELNEAVGASDYAPKLGATRHDSSSSANSGQVDGPKQDEDVFVGVTISYPSEHQLAITTEVDPEIPVVEEKEATVEFLDPTELIGSVGQDDREVEEVEEGVEEPKVEPEPEDVLEGGDGEEVDVGEEEHGDEEKHIYVANIESDYDVSQQLQAMNEVELAISEGDEDEPAPVITESMIQRMEEYMRAKSELEDTIDDFEKNVGQEAGEDAQEESPEVEEVDEVDLEDEQLEEPKTEVDEGANLDDEPLKEPETEVDAKTILKDEPLEDTETKVDADEGANPEDELVEEPGAVVDEETNLKDEIKPLEPVEIETKVEEGANLADEPLKEPETEITEPTEPSEVPEPKVPELEVSDPIAELPTDTSEPNAEEPAGDEPSMTVADETVIEEALPAPIIIEEESASDGSATPPPVAEESAPETIPFAEKVQKLETMIKAFPQKIPRPSDESEIEVDNLVVENITPEIPPVQMSEIKGVEAVVPVSDDKEPDDIHDVPPPSESEEDQEVGAGLSNLEDVLAESMEHIPAPLDDTDETPLVEEVEVKPAVEEPAVELSEAPKRDEIRVPAEVLLAPSVKVNVKPAVEEPAVELSEAPKRDEIRVPAEVLLAPSVKVNVKPAVEEPTVELSEAPKRDTIRVPAEVLLAPSVKVEKSVVEAEDQPEPQHIEVSKPAETEEVVVKEHFEEVSPPAEAVDVDPEDDLEIEDLEVIKEAETEEEGALAEHPLSESEEVVMKPDKTPLPNNSTLNMGPRRYSFEAEKSEEELERPARASKRSLNSSGHTSDSDRSTASEKDTSSGYHEDYETSDGDELGTSYDKVPDVIMEQDPHTRSILKGSTRESADSGKQSLSSTPSLPKQQTRPEDDDVFEEERAKGLNMPTEGHVREAVFTKAIESAINPLAYGIQIPNMGELQSASIVLPSKKAIRKASGGEYDYHGRRTNLQKVISKPHTEKTDMEWDEKDQARNQDKTDGQTRDEKVHNWSGTLRSSQKKKKPFRTKKISEDDILNAITQQAAAVKKTCPVHAAAHGTPVTGPPKRRVPSTKRPGTAPRKTTPTSRPAARPSTAPKTTPTKPKASNVKAKVDSRRPSSSSLPASKPAAKGSKAIAVKPASRTSNPQEVMSIAASPSSGPLTTPKTKPALKVTKSTPIRRTGSLKEGQRAPLKLSNSLPRDKIRHGPKCTDLP